MGSEAEITLEQRRSQMTAVADSTAIPLREKSARSRMGWLQGGLLAVLTGVLYLRVLHELVQQWWDDPNFSHGFLVPLFSAFVIWRERKKLAGLAVKPRWSGIVIIAGALLVLIAGVLGAEQFLSRTSLLLLVAGMVIYFLGEDYFREVFFPWAMLFLMIPIPAIIYNQIALPLQFLASRLATALLGLLGVPVLREGNVIHLPSMSLEVAEACSGIRSLMSLVTLAVIYGYFFEPSRMRRVVLAIAAIPIAVVANGIRVMGTGLLGQYWSPDKAEGFFHLFSGWLIFLVSIGILYLVHLSLIRLERLRGARSP